MNKEPEIDWINTSLLQFPSCSKASLSLLPMDFEFFHIQEITYEDDAPRREAFENVLGSLRLKGVNFIYLMFGSQKGISFYFGVAKNGNTQLEVDIHDIAHQILLANIEGNFRGSRVERLRKTDKLELQSQIQNFRYVAQVQGVPELNEEAEQFQGIDRLVDIMFKDEFVLMIISSAVSSVEIKTIERTLYSIHDKISPLVKRMLQKTYSNAKSNSESSATVHAVAKSKQESNSVSESDSHSSNSIESTSNTKSKTQSKSESESNSSGGSTNNSRSSNDSESESESDTSSSSTVTTTSESNSTNNNGSKYSTSKGSSQQDSKNIQRSNTKSKTKSFQNSQTESNTTSTQFTRVKNKSENNQESSSDSHSTSIQQVKSTQKGSSNSQSVSDTDSQTKSSNYMENQIENETLNIELAKKELEEWLSYIDEVLLKRVHYAKGSGGFKTGIYLFADTKGKIKKLGNSFISLFSGSQQNQVPLQYDYVQDEKHKQSIYQFQLPSYDLQLSPEQQQRMILDSKIDGINWFSSKELSLVASLPQREVIGLRLKEEVEFGLNIPAVEGLSLGKLVRNGQEVDIKVNLRREDLNQHVFVTGVTGSGKTTTCHKILSTSDLPFLVIEPAKTEYRSLAERDDVLVFTIGNEQIAPFRLNPFEFFEGENIAARADMIRAAIESSFDMEAAIPQIIEAAIYRSYEQYGWDIGNSQNYRFEQPFAKGVKAFPLLEDVIKKVEQIVEEQNFDERLKKDYIGSIRARLQGLIIGAKGFTLNTPRSFDFRELVKRKVVIELEEIKNPSEKSLIMGLILINLNEAIKSVYRQESAEGRRFQHITLVEEAHRLLSRFELGDSLNKKNGVEAFSDMLAEMRKYGESLIIVDQIPNKLTPEVLKNTNTKIVHRLFAADDKEAIGNTMALAKEQKEFLSKLDVGKAIVFNQHFYYSVQVKIIPSSDTSALSEIAEPQLRQIWLAFYQQEQGLNDFSLEDVNSLIELETLWAGFIEAEKNGNKTMCQNYESKVKQFLNNSSLALNSAGDFLRQRFYEGKKEEIMEILTALKAGERLGLKIKFVRN